MIKLKLIDAKPLSNELIDAFYKNLEEQKEELKGSELDSTTTRRKFLQYSLLGAIGIGLSFGTERAKAGGDDYYYDNPCKGLNRNFEILPELVLVNQKYLTPEESARGRIRVSNPTNNYHSGQMELELISSEDLRYSQKTYLSYDIPAFTQAIYEFEDGPLAVAIRDIFVRVLVSNEYGSTESKELVLFA